MVEIQDDPALLRDVQRPRAGCADVAEGDAEAPDRPWSVERGDGDRRDGLLLEWHVRPRRTRSAWHAAVAPRLARSGLDRGLGLDVDDRLGARLGRGRDHANALAAIDRVEEAPDLAAQPLQLLLLCGPPFSSAR